MFLIYDQLTKRDEVTDVLTAWLACKVDRVQVGGVALRLAWSIANTASASHARLARVRLLYQADFGSN
jgi:hypothetical protein